MDAYGIERYRQACALLPQRLRPAALAVPPGEQERAEELRLRMDRPMCLTLPEGEREVDSRPVIREDLEQLLNTVTGYSRYTASETLRQGYLTAQGGFRVGLCGSAVMEGEHISLLRDFSSLSVRIPREKPGIAAPVLEKIWDPAGGRVENTLIIAAPGAGKTTLLRDLVRLLSDRCGLRVALADERGELAAMRQGRAQLQVGRHTDVMDGCPKALAIPALLRAMNPQVIAVDEITAAADVEAMERAAHTGAALLATVHGSTVEELRQRRLFAALLETGVFSRGVCICRDGRERRYEVRTLC